MAERLTAAAEDGECILAVKCLNLPAGRQNFYFCPREKVLWEEAFPLSSRRQLTRRVEASKLLRCWRERSLCLWRTCYKPLELSLLQSKELFVLNNNIVVSCLSSSQRKPLLSPPPHSGEWPALPCLSSPVGALCAEAGTSARPRSQHRLLGLPAVLPITPA